MSIILRKTLAFSAALWFTYQPVLASLGPCEIVFDGRIPLTYKLSTFDTNSSVFDDQFVHGENQTWAQIIDFPNVIPSLFDTLAFTKPLEISITDESIFVPGGGPPQLGFRRSELLPAINNGTDVTVEGTTTFHWSMRSDSKHPLNFAHENQLVFHENNAFSIDQFMLKTGTPFNTTISEAEAKTLRLQGSQTSDPITFFSTPFLDNVWHNFAVTVGWTTNDFIVHYSLGDAPLRVVNVTTNDNSGQGQFHTGILKLPLGDADIDVVHEGFQESGIHESLIYSGIFIEKNSDGCQTRLF